MTVICCISCDWAGHTYSANPLALEDIASLHPGMPMPYGRCPECGELVPFSAPQTDSLHPQFSWGDDRPERRNLTQFQRDCLLVALARLDPDHPGFRASPEIAVALRSTIGSEIPIPDDRAPPFNSLTMHPYMDSWVYPLLVGALYGEVFPGQRNYVSNDANLVRTALVKDGASHDDR